MKSTICEPDNLDLLEKRFKSSCGRGFQLKKHQFKSGMGYRYCVRRGRDEGDLFPLFFSTQIRSRLKNLILTPQNIRLPLLERDLSLSSWKRLLHAPTIQPILKKKKPERIIEGALFSVNLAGWSVSHFLSSGRGEILAVSVRF